MLSKVKFFLRIVNFGEFFGLCMAHVTEGAGGLRSLPPYFLCSAFPEVWRNFRTGHRT